MKHRLVIFSVGIALSLHGQPQPQMRGGTSVSGAIAPAASAEAPVKPEERCAVEGNVYNSATGEPVRKANLMLRRSEPTAAGSSGTMYSAVTDTGGHFTIADIEPGKFRLSVDKAGFVSQQYGSRSGNQGGGTVLALEKSQKLRDVNFKLIAHGVITGRVLDEDGDPVQHVIVQMLRSAYFRGRKQMVPNGSANTNDLGEYRLSGLAPGRYVLSATYSGGFRMEPTQSATDEAYLPTYYPSGQTPDAGAVIEITPGIQLKGMDIRLSKAHAVKIRGRVVPFAQGKTVRNVNIGLAPKADQLPNMMMRNMSRPTNDQGDFVLNNVAPGTYVLTAFQAEDGKYLSARLSLEVGTSTVEGLTLQLNPGGEVTGRVIFDGPAVDMKSARFMLSPKNMNGMMFGPSAQGGMVKEDNTFPFTSVQPDLFELRVMGLSDGCYMKSVKVGDAETIESGIDFTSGVNSAEITAVISAKAAKIEGSVQNEKLETAKSAMIVLIPEGKRRESDRYYAVSSTDQYGHFTLKNLAPGDYRAFAFDNAEIGAYQDPEWLKPYESKGEKLTIEEGSTQSVQLKLVVTQ